MIETGIPNDLALYSTLKYDGVVSRINSYQPANPQNGYSAGQLITFQMPMEFLDFRNHSFQFRIQTAVTGGSYARFNTDIRSLFKRITIAFGSKIVYDCTDQNVLFAIMNYTKDINWSLTQGVVLNGTGSTIQRQADFIDPNRTYAVQLYDLRQQLLSQALPLQKLNVQLFINIYLAPNNEVIETDGTNPSYVLNDCQLHISSLIPSPGWDMMWNSKIGEGIPYNYLNFENNFDSSILTSGQTRASKTLNFRYSSLTALIAVMRPTATLQSLAANNKINAFSFNNLNSCQLRIGSYVQPTDDLANLADRLTMLDEVFGISTQFPIAAAQNWSTSSFIIGINLSKHPFSQCGQNTQLNGINTSISSAMILDLGFNSPLPANYTLDVFAISECSVIFQQNGGIVWQN